MFALVSCYHRSYKHHLKVTCLPWSRACLCKLLSELTHAGSCHWQIDWASQTNSQDCDDTWGIAKLAQMGKACHQFHDLLDIEKVGPSVFRPTPCKFNQRSPLSMIVIGKRLELQQDFNRLALRHSGSPIQQTVYEDLFELVNELFNHIFILLLHDKRLSQEI